MDPKAAKAGSVANYVRIAWILKIRLISARLELFDARVSWIHLERACLQLRKACECIAYLCLVLAHLQHDKKYSKLMKEYKVGLIFNKLQRDGSLSLPGVARQYPKSTSGDKTTWQLDLHTPSADYAARISKLHNYCGQMLHEFKIDEPIPETEGAAMQELSKAYSIARDAHKWLWNRFWHQYVMLDGRLLAIHLGDHTESSMPFVLHDEAIISRVPEVRFEAEFLANFVSPVSWDDEVIV